MLENFSSMGTIVWSVVGGGITLLLISGWGLFFFCRESLKEHQREVEKIRRFRDYFITQQDVNRVLTAKALEFDMVCAYQIKTQQETKATITAQELLRRYYAAAERIKAYKHNFWWLSEIAKENGFRTWRSYKDYLPPTPCDNPAPASQTTQAQAQEMPNDPTDVGFGMPTEQQISDTLGKEFEI